jgi:hypothetical protein
LCSVLGGTLTRLAALRDLSRVRER